MAEQVLDLPLIRAAATDVGNRYMAAHPDERPEGTAGWTRNAYNAAITEFHRLCRTAGVSPFTLPGERPE